MADRPDRLWIELLGPVEAVVHGRAVALGGRRPRTLFALLALRPGQVVASEAIVDALWGEDPPLRARESLQMHVSRLRKAFADLGTDAGRFVRRAGGYMLDTSGGDRDLDQWHGALGRARRAREAGEPAAARAEIDAGLRLWGGQPLGGVVLNNVLAAERARLEEQRLEAVIEGIELDLELGRHGEVLGQLDALALAHPFAEHLVELQMLALYRSGRQADALAAFRAARDRLVEELGIEPGERLCALHEDVLRHSGELAAPKAARRASRDEAVTEPRGAPSSAPRPLPVPPNRTIGRDRELAAIGAGLRSRATRLLTLTGPGGVGKTRLAIEAARAVEGDFADGACFVSCAPLRDPAQVASAIAEALGAGVLGGESPAQAAERFLATKHLLLVADNFEHVLAAAPVVGGLLAGCPNLTVLATSREPLALQAEERRPVAPLAVPDSGASPEADAVTLFSDRARARDPGFALDEVTAAAVAQICRRVDGLPLAIELAAARCGILSPSEVAERLDEALAAPGAGARDAAARQQTLRATVDWSHALLDDDERAGFARFAVFAGGATVHATEAVTGARLWTIDGLVTKSLLVRRRQPSGPTRLHMLETIRAYAADKLAARADGHEIRERHYRHFLALAERHGAERVLMDADCQGHIERLETEIDNLHAALAWAIERRDARAALRLCVALEHFWWISMRYEEAISWIDRALDLPAAKADAALRVRALCSKGLALWPFRRNAEIRSTLAEADRVARALGDPLIVSHALQVRARLEATDDATTDFGPSIAMAEEAFQLAVAAGDSWATAKAAYATAIAADTIDDHHRCTARAADLLAETGDVYHLARILSAGAINGLLLGGSVVDAKAYADRAAELLHDLHDLQSRAFVLANIGLVAVIAGDTDGAETALRQQLALGRDHLTARYAYDGLKGLAAVAAVHQQDDRCAHLVGAAAAHAVTGALPDPVDAMFQTDFFGPARARLGEDRWATAVRDGADRSLEEAITYALQRPGA
jgi:predicted ATPase/DNA-binding SARP family transcriptional activator